MIHLPFGMKNKAVEGDDSLTAYLELNRFGHLGKGAESRGRVLEIQHLHIAVVGAVHRLEARHLLEHGDHHVAVVIVDQFTRDTNPLSALEGAYLSLRIDGELF